MTDGQKIREFVLKLSTDDAFLGRYVRDPKGIMTSFGLPPDAIAAFLSGDVPKVRALFGDKGPEENTLVFAVPTRREHR
jgi:hypothetical protein